MSQDMLKIQSCEVCGSKDLKPVLNLGKHPMCDDLVAINDNRVCAEYPIEIVFCENCITAHQKYQVPKKELFPKSYHYRSRHTADVLNGMRQLVGTCSEKIGDLKGKKVLDIGCNDGSLLSIFKEFGAKTFGIEPTGAAQDAIANGHIVEADFLSEDLAKSFVASHGNPDIITFTNVFAHIEDLGAVVRSLKALSNKGTVLVIENHYLGAILEKIQFDTFYHEHPRTYSYTSFCKIADLLNMSIASVEFPKRYGGNIRVIMKSSVAAKPEHDRFEEIYAVEKSFGPQLANMAKLIENWKVHKLAEIKQEVKAHGKLYAKAFPGRAAIPIKMLGLDQDMITGVYEKPQSGKIGHYVPGTRIPILSDDEFQNIRTTDAPLINLAWHISDEIHSYMRSRGFKGKLIDIMAPQDFQEIR